MVDLIAPRLDRVPAALTSRKQWVVWRAEEKVKRGPDGEPITKITKVPYQAVTGRVASSMRSSTWSSFEDACQAYLIDGWDGIGYVFSADDPFVGIDLDNCFDEKGKLRPDAENAVRSLRSYTEKSVSGNGLHIICEGRLPGSGHCDKKTGREMYQEGRFFTITAELITEKLADIVNRAAEARAIYEEWFGQGALDGNYIAGDLEWDAEAPLVPLDQAGVTDYVKDLIVEGGGIEDFPSDDGAEGDRSAALFFACRELVSAGVNKESILTILSDSDNFLAQPGLERRAGNVASAREWVWKYSLAKVVNRWQQEAELFDDVIGSGEEDADSDDLDGMEVVPYSTSEPAKPKDSKSLGFEKGAFELNALTFLKHVTPLVRCNKEYFAYNGKYWKLYSEESVERDVAVSMRGRDFPMSTINNTITAVKRFAVKDEFRPSRTKIAFQNGVIDLAGWDDGMVTPELVPHDQKHRSTSMLEFNFDPEAQCPTWLSFLNSTLESDAQRLRLLKQWIGYNLVWDYRYQKMMLMAGESRSGKGVIVNTVMKALVGLDCFAGTSLSNLAGDFGLEQLVHAKTAIIGDAHHGQRDRIGRAKETLLNVTGNDLVAVNRKNKGEITCQVPARITMLANELPRFSDGYDALGNRYLVLPFNLSFAGREDVNLPDKLKKELPGIFNWALEGLLDLALSGKFCEPEASETKKEEIRMHQNPVAFFEKSFMRSAGGDFDQKVEVDQLYYAYESFCRQIDMRPLNKNWLGRALSKVAPYTEKVRLRDGGDRGYFYNNLTLDMEALEEFCGSTI